MSVHYSAFISYRHAKKDTGIAAYVQQSLEHFRVPGQIREKTGIKKISRIFRDKEELPITSSLSESIGEALDNSDFLIVICSVRTKESYWVSREIEYFLKSNSKDKVLTVLVDGEPKDVIPEILRVDREIYVRPDGTEYVEEKLREPLSCDLRSGNMWAKHKEILRLAASLLGCAYDELVMRDKQYKRKRLSAVIGAAGIAMLCAALYMKWSSDRIRQNYLKSQENRSVYLSTQSRKLLEEGDRITAIQLAEAALPHDDERPLVPEAEYALAAALHVYTPPGTSSLETFDTVLSFQADGVLNDYTISPDNRYLCAIDDYSRLYMWDAQTGEELFRLSREKDGTPGIIGNAEKVLFDPDDNLILLTDTHVLSYRAADGSLLWDYELESGAGTSKMKLDFSKPILYLGYVVNPLAADDTNMLNCICLDTVSGKETNRLSIELPENDFAICSDCALSSDRRYIALGISQIKSGGYEYALYVFDMDSGSVKKMELPAAKGTVDSVSFTGTTNQLTAMIYPDYEAYEGQPIEFASVRRLIGDRRIQVLAFDVTNGRCKWSTEFTNSRPSYMPAGMGLCGFNHQHRTLEDGGLTDYILCIYANQALIFNVDDGSVYDSIEFEGLILNAFQTSGGNLSFLLHNGNIGSYLFDDAWKGVEADYFPAVYHSGLNYGDLKTGHALYALQNEGNSIQVFGKVIDNDLTRFESEPLPPDFNVKHSMTVGDHLVLIDYDENIYSYDLSGQDKVAAGSLDSSFIFTQEDDANGVVWFLGREKWLARFSVTDGRTVQYELPNYMNLDRFWLLPDGKICSLSFDNCLVVSEEADGKLVSKRYAVVNCPQDLRTINTSPSGLHFLITGKDSDEQCKVLFFELGDKIQMEPDQPESDIWAKPARTLHGSEMAIDGPITVAAWDEQEKYCSFTDSQTVYAADIKGNLLFTAKKAGLTARSLCIHDNVLFVLYSAGKLVRYDIKTGRELGVTDINFIYNYSGESSLTGALKQAEWIFLDDSLILNANDNDDFVHIIDIRSWKETADCLYACGYDRLRDRLLILDHDPDTKQRYIGWYPRYTPDDLLRKAEEAVGTMRLSEEERVYYGIE